MALIFKMDRLPAMTTAMARETRSGNEIDLEQRHRDGHEKETKKETWKRVYKKEATVTVDLMDLDDVRAVDIIISVTEKVGEGKILAVRPKQTRCYEVTLETEEDIEELMNGIIIKGKTCEVTRLQNRDFVVSFMHLPVYMDDEDILKKLEGWGVLPISKIKRRFYPGTNIEDGTRFVKTRFPREVISLPYSTKFVTAEGPQYFRVMHSQQVKTCRLCMSPEHMVKDCPQFICYKCNERGHMARDCRVVKCPDCEEVLSKCECWMGNEEEDEEGVSGQMHDGEKEQEEGTTTTQINETNENKDKGEQRKESYIQDKQSQQGGEAEMQIAETVEILLDKIEHQRIVNEEQTVERGSEEEKEDKAGIQMKRRRSIKVKPSLGGVRKKVVKEDLLKNVNRFELLKDMGEIE